MRDKARALAAALMRALKKLATPQRNDCRVCGVCHRLCVWTKEKKPLSKED